MARLTLPQQRAQETRKRIIGAAGRVFTRGGYGTTAVDAILEEAGISRGAFYHHFANKEELFRAMLDEHLREDLVEVEVFRTASSLRDVIDRFVDLLIGDIKGHQQSGSLSFEFMAQATREDWARRPYAEFHRRAHDLIAGVLRAGQSGGVVRSDLDADEAAWLLIAVREGLSALTALDSKGVDLHQLRGSWADLIERFVQSDGQAAASAIQEPTAVVADDLADQYEDKASA